MILPYDPRADLQALLAKDRQFYLRFKEAALALAQELSRVVMLGGQEDAAARTRLQAQWEQALQQAVQSVPGFSRLSPKANKSAVEIAEAIIS